MDYFIFSTKAEALTTEALICSNIRNFMEANIPDAVAPDGSIRSRWADRDEYSDAVTSRWAIPRKTAAGTWALPAPTQERIEPVPLDVALDGVDADLAPEPEWPLAPRVIP